MGLVGSSYEIISVDEGMFHDWNSRSDGGLNHCRQVQIGDSSQSSIMTSRESRDVRITSLRWRGASFAWRSCLGKFYRKTRRLGDLAAETSTSLKNAKARLVATETMRRRSQASIAFLVTAGSNAFGQIQILQLSTCQRFQGCSVFVGSKA
jgi:hypothetical protein